MRNSNVETLKKVLEVLGKYLPICESEIYYEYQAVYKHFEAENTREKNSYKEKAEYHREISRKWRKNNSEKSRQYQRDYYARKNNKKLRRNKNYVKQGYFNGTSNAGP